MEFQKQVGQSLQVSFPIQTRFTMVPKSRGGPKQPDQSCHRFYGGLAANSTSGPERDPFARTLASLSGLAADGPAIVERPAAYSQQSTQHDRQVGPTYPSCTAVGAASRAVPEFRGASFQLALRLLACRPAQPLHAQQDAFNRADFLPQNSRKRLQIRGVGQRRACTWR